MLTVKIVHDDCAENPRTAFDHVGRMQISGRRIVCIDETKGRTTKEGAREIFCVLPIYRFEHSGVAYDVNPFSCKWDSGRVGLIVAYRDDVEAAFGFKIRTKKALEKVLACLRAEVQEYSDWASGEVYGYQIIDDSDGEEKEIDSCYGFYGMTHVQESAADALSHHNRVRSLTRHVLANC